MSFKITPLGGLGQIGANTISVQFGGEHIVIDAGILFPNDDLFDINYLIPDYELLEKNPPSKLFITHGHEDHIGAVSHLVRLFPEIEIFAPPFAAKLIQIRLDNDKLSARIITYRHNEKIDLGPFFITPFHLTHSIPETHGLFVGDHKNELSFFYASDFKSDEAPLFEKKNDYNLLRKMSGPFQSRLLMADSTNILKEGRSANDQMIIPHFEELFKKDCQRIFITLFSSNVYRLQLIFDHAKASGRKVYPIGRSILNMINSAKELSLLDDHGLTLPDRYPNLKAHNLIVLLSGPQGDYKGALRRFALGEDSTFKPKVGDLLIMSSRPIPGNERKVSAIVNTLIEKGVEVITATDRRVHTTGHASQEDLKDLYLALSPTHAIPVHGESYFLKRHQDFIHKNFPEVKSELVFNFHEITFSNHGISIKKHEAPDPKIIHSQGHLIEREVISERRKVAQGGAIFISLNTESKPKQLHSEIRFLGIPTAANQYQENIDHLIKHHLRDIKKDPEDGKEKLRIAIRRLFNEKLGIKPTTIIHLV